MKIQNKTNDSERWWDNDDFQDHLTALLIYDQTSLRACAPLLTVNDFRPLRPSFHGRERWIVAERALEHYQKYKEPLGNLLRSDTLEYAEQIGMGASHVAKLKDYIEFIGKLKSESPGAITEKVVRYKTERFKAAGIQELIDAQNAGTLTDERWLEISQRALTGSSQRSETINYLATLDDRIARRRTLKEPAPWTFIDPLDSMVRCVGPKQLGLVIAPYKRGKSLFLLWLAAAYALQRLNVLYFTLEDPRSIVEDRLDALVTHLPVKMLGDLPKTLTKRFNRFKGMIKTKIEIYDGTAESITVSSIENTLLACRERGFLVDCILIDYDEEIVASQGYKDKRYESDEIYRNLRQMASKYNLVMWTAAQTQRNTRHLKILSGDR